MKKLIIICMFVLTASLACAFDTSKFSFGGQIDVNLDTSSDPSGSAGISAEYRPFRIFSVGIKADAMTNFKKTFGVQPMLFARLYPFSGLFIEGSGGGRFEWTKGSPMSKYGVAGAAAGWRIELGGFYTEPKINCEYVFGAKEPFSWGAGIGAGFRF